jgi:hypothetical protein
MQYRVTQVIQSVKDDSEPKTVVWYTGDDKAEAMSAMTTAALGPDRLARIWYRLVGVSMEVIEDETCLPCQEGESCEYGVDDACNGPKRENGIHVQP